MGVAMSRQWEDTAGRTLPLLAAQMLFRYTRAGASRPPVTAALIAANALVYLRPGAIDAHIPWLRHVMFNPHLIIKFGDLRRFFLSPVYHVNEVHFFMNMTSLLRMGVKLETSMGSPEFASMVVSLLGLSQGFTLLLSKGLLLLGNDMPYYQFSAGFSGVLFGMNVVRNARAGDVVWLAVVVPAKYVPLLELILLHALNPEAHFIVNVGGILAGLTYLCLRRGSEPLALMFSDITHFVSQPVRFAKRLLRSAAHRRGSERLALMFSGITDFVSQPVRFANRLLRSAAHHRGSSVRRHVTSAPREIGQGMWRCITCSCDNSCCADVCEMCSTPHPDRSFSRRKHLQDGGNSELQYQSRSSAAGGSKDLKDDADYHCYNSVSK